MSHETSSTRTATGLRTNAPASTGFAFLDMMLQMQKASQQALSSFIPLATPGAAAEGARFDQRAGAKTAERSSNSIEVIPVGEETFHVGTRTIHGETTRLRRIVVETPVEQQVSLRTETVVVERRKPVSSIATGDILSEKTIEMTDSFEVVDSWKSVHLREEVVLRTEVVEHTETVRDVVRRDEVTVEQASAAPRRELKAPAVEAVAKRIAENIEAARPAAEVRMQDAVPAPAVKAESDRPAPAPMPAPAPTPAPASIRAEPMQQDRKPAAPQPDAKPATGAFTAGEPDTSKAPRADANPADKASAGPVRRA